MISKGVEYRPALVQSACFNKCAQGLFSQQEVLIGPAIARIRPGEEHYKLILLRSPETPINREYLYLLDQGLIKEIGEYYRWILGLPLALLIGWSFLQRLVTLSQKTVPKLDL